jgi:hypothetical protein
MTRTQFSILIATILAASMIIAGVVHAQSYGAIGFAPIAPAVSNCPAPAATYTVICAVGTAAPYALMVSYNAGAYQNLVTAPTAITGTGPIVVSNSGSISCPSCVTGNVVTSFNTRSGAVGLTKADITGTGIAVTTTSTSTMQ